MTSQIFKNKIDIKILFSLFDLVTTQQSNDHPNYHPNDYPNDYPNDHPNDYPNDHPNDYPNDHSKYYILDKTIFKKLQFNNYIQNFLDNIINYYHISKQYYVTRTITYNNFLTIVRQICKINNIKIIKKILYNKSSYDIIYYVYI